MEIVVATLITGGVIVGALDVLGGAVKTRLVTLAYVDGPILANELLAEIMSRSYVDPEDPGLGTVLGVGLEPGESNTRSTFDDVDDYWDWSASPPIDSNDAPMTQFTGWTRAVSWEYVLATNGVFSALDTGLAKLTVTVTAPDGTVTRRVGFRSKDGALEQPPAIDTEYVTWIGAELQIGAVGLARTGTNLINTATD